MSEIQGKPVFGVCACKEKVQVLSVDQVVDLIQQMAENNWQVPEDYIPKTSVNGIIEQNTKAELKLWIGTQAEYDAYAEDKSNLFAIITDDPSLKEINNKLTQYGRSIENINTNISNILNGTTAVHTAQYASSDTSKGTIEERLTNLGFKSGTITVSFANGVSISAENNTIYRQGNYVILPKLKIYSTDTTMQIPVEEVVLTLPEEFRPPKTVQGVARIITQPNYENEYGSYCTFEIKTTGELIFDSVTLANTIITTTTILIENIGYEVNPIT